MIDISKNARAKCIDSCRKAYPSEACGVLLKKSGNEIIDDAVPMYNIMDKDRAGTHFSVDPYELYKLEKELETKGYDIAGFYHSHPDCAAVPSGEDLEHMVPGLTYLIISITKAEKGFNEEIKEYRIDI